MKTERLIVVLCFLIVAFVIGVLVGRRMSVVYNISSLDQLNIATVENLNARSDKGNKPAE
jgi:hypothetical protein